MILLARANELTLPKAKAKARAELKAHPNRLPLTLAHPHAGYVQKPCQMAQATLTETCARGCSKLRLKLNRTGITT